MKYLRRNAPWQRIVLVLMAAVIYSCSARAKFISKSDPNIAKLDRDAYLIEVSAIKKDFVHHNMFMLTVSNKGRAPLSIDWNRSGWFINGKDGGKFVFKDISPADIKENKVGETIIQPDQIEKMEIAPLKLIAWIPLKYKTDRSGRAISAGMLPKGDHTIHLVLTQNGTTINEKVDITILHEPIK